MLLCMFQKENKVKRSHEKFRRPHLGRSESVGALLLSVLLLPHHVGLGTAFIFLSFLI